MDNGKGRKEMYIYGYMVKDHSHNERKPATAALPSRVLLYALSHTQDSTYHGLCYTSRGALARTRNTSMDSP